MSISGKKCVFCGKPFAGQKKSFEHIIPRWLAEVADLNKRTTDVHLPNAVRKIGMGRIGLKVCDKCNNDGSNLEAEAKKAFTTIESGEELTAEQIRVLLDWLDKVRVGLWLWLIESGKEPLSPKFRIRDRLAAKDRLLTVQRYPSGPPMKGLAFWGTGEFFIGYPSVLGMLINNVALVSISADFVVTRHIRDVAVEMEHGPGLLDAFSLIKSRPNEPRLSFLGSPRTFAQCILPTEMFEEHDIPVLRQSELHEGWSESPIMHLDDNLRELPDADYRIEEFSGNIGANAKLMELNAAVAIRYLVNMLRTADRSKLDSEQRAGWKHGSDRALSQINALVREVKRHYRIESGITLPDLL